MFLLLKNNHERSPLLCKHNQACKSLDKYKSRSMQRRYFQNVEGLCILNSLQEFTA